MLFHPCSCSSHLIFQEGLFSKGLCMCTSKGMCHKCFPFLKYTYSWSFQYRWIEWILCLIEWIPTTMGFLMNIELFVLKWICILIWFMYCTAVISVIYICFIFITEMKMPTHATKLLKYLTAKCILKFQSKIPHILMQNTSQ